MIIYNLLINIMSHFCANDIKESKNIPIPSQATYETEYVYPNSCILTYDTNYEPISIEFIATCGNMEMKLLH